MPDPFAIEVDSFYNTIVLRSPDDYEPLAPVGFPPNPNSSPADQAGSSSTPTARRPRRPPRPGRALRSSPGRIPGWSDLDVATGRGRTDRCDDARRDYRHRSFRDAGALAVYAGVAPRTHRSGTSIKGEHRQHSGNATTENELRAGTTDPKSSASPAARATCSTPCCGTAANTRALTTGQRNTLGCGITRAVFSGAHCRGSGS
ncbi:transposase [Rhodococcus erythropolis]|uniref:transposase n=1 Tax=Rhodococcus erythropolis TaxID=1833 RepID=UPI00398270D8